MSLCGFFLTWLFIFFALFLQTCVGGALGQKPPPSPELVQLSTGVSSDVSSGLSSGVWIRCQAPPGHSGRVFELYRVRSLVDSRRFDTEHSHADFRLNTDGANTEIYCCRYDLSMYSPYTRLHPPSRPSTPLAPPQLSVKPPDGRVQRGQVIEFHCQALPTPVPVAFVLQKQHGEGEEIQFVSHSTNPQFWVGPVGVADGGMYTCFYVVNLPQGNQSSAPSAPVSVTVRVDLPAPLLSEGGEGVLVCTGSPSYPGAHFSLFQQGSSLPLATQSAQNIQHIVQFAAAGRRRKGDGYQCQYSVLLGNNWEHSELSSPITLTCITGSPSCSPSSTDTHTPYTGNTHTGSVDVALVCGSVSAALLFLMVLIVLALGIRKYAKIAANKKRQREQEQFWQQVHRRDHVVDLTLQRISTGSKDEGGGSEPIYDCPLSTFTRPPGY